MSRADDVADAALRHGIRISVAESLTSGLVASALGKGHEAATWFAGAVVAYRTDVKTRVLGVREGVDPCSAECAEQLAAGVRDLLGADIAISATGVGGPDPEDGHAPGTVYLGWSTATGTAHRLLHLEGSPDEILGQSVALSLDLLVELLDGPG